MNVNRYRITVDYDSFQEFYWGSFREGLSLTYLPVSEGDEDFVITCINNSETEEDVTVQILTEYSTWLSTRE